MDPDKQRAIAQKGGQAAHRQGKAHEFSSGEEARAAGRIGGALVSSDREHMSRIGRLGGLKRAKRAEGSTS
jgi:uncharacterized protein